MSFKTMAIKKEVKDKLDVIKRRTNLSWSRFFEYLLIKLKQENIQTDKDFFNWIYEDGEEE